MQMNRIKKKFLPYLLTVAFIMGLMPALAVSAYPTLTPWDGTTIDTAWYNSDGMDFTISEAAELAGLASLVNSGTDFSGKSIALAKDIDLGGDYEWTPIGKSTGVLPGSSVGSFMGNFDGGGYTVSGSVSITKNYAGMFGSLGNEAVVKNLNVNLAIAYTHNSPYSAYIGTLAGSNLGKLVNCTTAGSILADECYTCVYAGGLAGYNNGSILHCSSTADVTGGATNNYCTVGGLVGQCYYDSLVFDSYATGSLTAKGEGSQTSVYAGGFVGENNGTINNCYCAVGEITSSGPTIHEGGFAGGNAAYGILLDTYYDSAYAGDSVGYINGNATINKVTSLSTEEMTGTLPATITYYTGFTRATIYSAPVYTSATADSFVKALNLGSSALCSSNGAVWVADGSNENGGYPVFASYVPATAITVEGEGGADSITTEGGTLQLQAAVTPENATYHLAVWSTVSGDCATLSSTGLLESTYNGEITARATAVENSEIYNEKTFTVSGYPDYWQEVKATSFDGGDGTVYDPYQIRTAGQLALLAKLVNDHNNFSGEYFTLTADIDLSGKQWTPIGWYDKENSIQYLFSGYFDGAGHEITGLTIGSAESANSILERVGLFGGIYEGSIRNISVEVQIYAALNGAYVGGLAGATSNTDITNCNTSGNIALTNANVVSAGGLAGYTTDSDITACYSDVDISATGASSYVGGLTGQYMDGTLYNSHAAGTVIANGDNSLAGGLSGGLWGTISNCFATGDATASGSGAYAGGFAAESGAVIQDSYATGNVSTGSAGVYFYAAAGGFVGNNYNTITNSYATGDVLTGSPNVDFGAYAGGFVGYNEYLLPAAPGLIENCYAAGSAFGGPDSTIGGFAGFNGSHLETAPFGTVLNGYYNSTYNAMNGIGHDDASDSHVLGLSAEEMTGTNSVPLSITYYTSYTDSTTNTSAAATNLVGALNGGTAVLSDGNYSGWVADESNTNSGYPVFTQFWQNNAETFAGGSGSVDDPYRIATAGQLANLANLVNDGADDGSYSYASYILTADIDLSGKQWTAIGNKDSFSGMFDGAGYKITNLTIGTFENPDTWICELGLFGYLSTSAIVDNVGIVDAAIYSTANHAVAGALAVENDGFITDCYSTGTITGGEGVYIGGLLGYNGGTVQNSYTTCDVISGSYSYVGGFVGESAYCYDDVPCIIENCYAAGSATSTGNYSSVGGFTGYNYGWIQNSYTTCDVTSDIYSSVGGFVGYNDSSYEQYLSIIENCYAAGSATVIGIDCYIGGFVGENDGTLVNGYYNGTLNVVGVGYTSSSDSQVVGLSTAVMTGSASESIIYYTSYTDSTVNTSATAANLVAALNGGTALLETESTLMSWKAGGSTNGGYPVLYTPTSTGDGTNSGGIASAPAVTVTTAVGTTTATISATAEAADKDGLAAAAVTSAQISLAITKAKQEAATQGSGSTVLELSVTAEAGTTGVEMTIPHAAFNTIADSTVDRLTITTPVAAITFDSTAIKSINDSSSADITISVRAADTSDLSGAAKAAYR